MALVLITTAKAQLLNVYTNSSDFLSAITPGYYTETFNTLSTNGVPITNNTRITTPTNFSGNGFSFTATTTKTGGNQLYGLTNGGGGDRWMSLWDPQFGLVFTNFSPNVSAIGGNFFATDFFGFYTNTPINVSILLSDSSIFTTNYFPGSINSYLGLMFATNVTELVISNAPSTPTQEFMTVDNFTVGVVPEPSTYALLSMAGAGLAGYVLRRRRR